MITDAQQTVSRRPPIAALACLDLTVELERLLHGAIERMHKPRETPYWTMLNLARFGDTLYEFAEYHDGKNADRYDVLTWTIDATGFGVRFLQRKLTHRAALRLYETLTGNVAPIGQL